MSDRWKVLVIDGPDSGRSFSLPDQQSLVIGSGSDSHTRMYCTYRQPTPDNNVAVRDMHEEPNNLTRYKKSPRTFSSLQAKQGWGQREKLLGIGNLPNCSKRVK